MVVVEKEITTLAVPPPAITVLGAGALVIENSEGPAKEMLPKVISVPPVFVITNVFVTVCDVICTFPKSVLSERSGVFDPSPAIVLPSPETFIWDDNTVAVTATLGVDVPQVPVVDT